MAEILYACGTDNDGFPECMGDGSTCGPDGCIALGEKIPDKAAPVCQCQRMSPITCSNSITQEDLLCDDCRDGCNMAFGAITGTPARGFHYRGEFRFE